MLNPAQPGIALNQADTRVFFDKILALFPGDADCNFTCSLRGSCEQFWHHMPTLSFTLDQTTYNLPPAAYSYFTGGNYGACKIVVGAHHAEESLLVLGDMFLQTFQPTLNFDTNELRLQLADDAPVGASFASSDIVDSGASGYTLMGVAGTAGAVFAVGAALYFKRWNTKKTDHAEWVKA